MQLTTTFNNYTYENPLMNAAGVYCETASELDLIKNSKAGSLITKTATLSPRKGNPAPRMAQLPLGSINSMGLPNLGIDYYLDYVCALPGQGAGVFLSTTGIEPDDFGKIMRKIEDSDFKGNVELNLSCPNVPGHPQVAYDFERTDEILSEVFSFFTKPMGVKLPPYFDLVHFDQIAKILNKYPLTYVNSVNSVGNGLYINSETETVVIKPKNGFGGLGGQYIKPVALANVWAFHQRLNPEIKIIGTGGVSNGQDVFELLLAGASLVQVGTQLGVEGPKVFERLTSELEKIMQAHGYEQIEDFVGKLKVL